MDRATGSEASQMTTEERRRAEIDAGDRGLRRHAARGVILNSAFMIVLFALALLQRVAVAGFLTREELGIWGIVFVTILSIGFLKQLGISDKYTQQSDADQELAFQRAFTIELLVSLAFFLLVAALLPLYAIVYGHDEIILPGLILALSIPISAFQTTFWVPYRRMQFVRHRTLTSIDPVVTFVVTISAAAAGAGYWCFPIGIGAGSVVGAIAGIVTSAYPLRLRIDRATVREYASFSLPILGFGLSALVVVQGSTLVAERTVGLAGLGAITLAASIATFADRVDQLVGQTLYPAVCAVVDRTELMFEAFIKSNRLALMWGMPFGVGVALFARDVIHYGLGDRWLPAAGLLSAVGLIAGFRQICFNWSVFMRATNNTRPIFLASLLSVASFALVMVPCMYAFELTGYVIGIATAAALQILVAGYYMSRLFSGFSLTPHIVRAILPSVPAAGAVLLVRLATGGHGSALGAGLELLLYVAVTAVATWFVERQLVIELIGYLRRQRDSGAQPAAQSA